jgi:hypothetical protein
LFSEPAHGYLIVARPLDDGRLSARHMPPQNMKKFRSQLYARGGWLDRFDARRNRFVPDFELVEDPK